MQTADQRRMLANEFKRGMKEDHKSDVRQETACNGERKTVQNNGEIKNVLRG